MRSVKNDLPVCGVVFSGEKRFIGAIYNGFAIIVIK